MTWSQNNASSSWGMQNSRYSCIHQPTQVCMLYSNWSCAYFSMNEKLPGKLQALVKWNLRLGLLSFPLPATHFDQWGINKHINIPSLPSSMRCSRVPPVQPHRQHSVIISDTAHQTHLNKFIRLGTQQNASLTLKKITMSNSKEHYLVWLL